MFKFEIKKIWKKILLSNKKEENFSKTGFLNQHLQNDLMKCGGEDVRCFPNCVKMRSIESKTIHTLNEMPGQYWRAKFTQAQFDMVVNMHRIFLYITYICQLFRLLWWWNFFFFFFYTGKKHVQKAYHLHWRTKNKF